jgi:hypothetical protein
VVVDRASCRVECRLHYLLPKVPFLHQLSFQRYGETPSLTFSITQYGNRHFNRELGLLCHAERLFWLYWVHSGCHSLPIHRRPASPTTRSSQYGGRNSAKRRALYHHQRYRVCSSSSLPESSADIFVRAVVTDLDLNDLSNPDVAEAVPDLLTDAGAACKDWTLIAGEHWKMGRWDRAEELLVAALKRESYAPKRCKTSR